MFLEVALQAAAVPSTTLQACQRPRQYQVLRPRRYQVLHQLPHKFQTLAMEVSQLWLLTKAVELEAWRHQLQLSVRQNAVERQVAKASAFALSGTLAG